MSSNQLKIIALISMTIDHIGYFVFPEVLWLRIIGRLAFPIFAFMIAQGCFYTRNIWRYFATMFSCALIMQLVYAICMHSLYQSIMTTFTLSILTVITLQNADKKRDFLSVTLFIFMIAIDVLICKFLPNTLETFQVDYGLFGVLLPVFAYLPVVFAKKIDTRNVVHNTNDNASSTIEQHRQTQAEMQSAALDITQSTTPNKAQNSAPKQRKHISKKMHYIMLACFGVGLMLLCFDVVRPSWNIQWYSLLSLLLLLFYNGKRGKWHMKYLFYIYYPCHILVLYIIGEIVAGAF